MKILEKFREIIPFLEENKYCGDSYFIIATDGEYQHFDCKISHDDNILFNLFVGVFSHIDKRMLKVIKDAMEFVYKNNLKTKEGN